MWLLSTRHLKLQYFSGPEAVTGGYAILSHVWLGEEQNFQDIRNLIALGVTLHDERVANKISAACRIAQQSGYAWIWIDTCCIDKSSSAELSEAINSMFRWYALAAICYAYLHDVPATSRHSAFSESRWFTRGWTLQELIAPRFLLFMSSDWVPLGTKALLAAVIQDIAGVDGDVLTFSKDVTAVSVARRMSWASRRQTTRPEDEAYCLMGIFGVNMPALYGEGRDAFRRLQEEIMKSSSDQSLFAWGDMLSPATSSMGLVRDTQDPANFLFAPSPTEFANSADITPISPRKAGGLLSTCCPMSVAGLDAVPEMIVTSYGVRCHLIVIGDEVYRLAVLACQDRRERCIGLILRRRHAPDDPLPQDYVGASFWDGLPSPRSQGIIVRRKTRVYRLVAISPETRHSLYMLNLADGKPSFGAAVGVNTEVYIMHRPPHVAHPWLRLYVSEPKCFFIPGWLGFGPSLHGFQCTDEHHAPRDPAQPLTLTFRHPTCNESFEIQLGRCGSSALWSTVSIFPTNITDHVAAYIAHVHPHVDPVSPAQFRTPFVLPHACGSVPPSRPSVNTSLALPYAMPVRSVIAFRTPPAGAVGRHLQVQSQSPYRATQCTTYHISGWKNHSCFFGDHNRSVQLTFTRWPSPESYCLEVQLGGRVYAGMLLEGHGDPQPLGPLGGDNS